MPGDVAPHRTGWLRQLVGADDPLPIDPDLGPEDLAPPVPGHRPSAAVLAAVLAGGFLGTLARYGVATAWPAGSDGFPAATFVINTSGAFALGVLLTVILERLPARRYRYLRPFAGTGLLGGWTTYSTLVVETATLGKGGDLALAAGYLALTLVCGVSAVTLGIAVGRVRTAVAAGTDGDRAGGGGPDEVPR